MSMKAIVITAAFGLSVTVAVAQTTAPLVEECAPPGGVWGTGNQYRSKIQKYSDKTAIYMAQNFATPDPNRWWRSPVFAWTGGTFNNAIGSSNTVTPEGDGYKVAARSYSAHFSCHPAGK
jgi:hypothetical protein